MSGCDDCSGTATFGGISDFLDLMPSTFKLAPLVGRDTFGKPTYGDDTPYRGHKNDKSHYIRGANGETILSSGIIWLATGDAITVQHRLTLPNGSTALILDVNGGDDETGATLFTRLDLG